MASRSPQRVGMEPLARLIRERMDVEGLRVADVARITGLDRRHVSQMINRSEPYVDGPQIDTMQQLAKIPGLNITEIAQAVAESTGQPIPPPPGDLAPMTPLRRSVHAVVDKIPEERLGEALQHLTVML